MVEAQQDAAGAEPAPRRLAVDDFSLLSRQLYLYCVPLIMRGWSRALDESTALVTPACMTSVAGAPIAKQAWPLSAKSVGGKRSFARSFFYTVRWTAVEGLSIGVFNGVLNSLVRPLLLRLCIFSLAEPLEGSETRTLVLWAALFVVSLLEGWSSARTMAICSDDVFTHFLVFASRLMCSKSFIVAAGASGAAEVSSLMGNDVVRAFETARALGFLPLGLAAVVGGVVMLLATVGVASLCGILSMGLILVLTQKIAGMTAVQTRKSLEVSARRLAILEQIVDSSKAVKFFSWEEPYLKMLSTTRDEEVRVVKKVRWLLVVSIQMGRMSPILSAAVTIACMVLLGQELRAADIFSTIAVFMALRLALIVIPQGWSSTKMVLVSFNRIQAYLELPEESPRPLLPEGSSAAVEAVKAEIAWPVTASNAGKPKGATVSKAAKQKEVEKTEKEVPRVVVSGSLRVARGQLAAIVGPVGSGKTTLLSAIVGELTPVAGSVRGAARLAYAPQQPQVFCGTVRENIVLGRPYDEAALRRAVEATEMAHDLEILAAGLESEIGERGVSLSGGQKQRISLARTVYAIPDDAVLVLDDPIAAVDPLVGRRIIQKVVLAHQERGGTAVVALNQEAYLHHFDVVLSLEGGRVVERPAPAKAAEGAGSAEHDAQAEADAGKPDPTNSRPLLRKDSSVILDEKRKKGAMKSQVMLVFVQSMGWHYLLPFLLAGVAAYTLMAGADLWLSRWTGLGPLDQGEHLRNLAIYISLVLAFSASILVCSRIAVLGTLRASKRLHQDCVSCLMRAPLEWWDGTPKGRITSRFSTDMGIIDTQLGFMLDNFTQIGMNIVALSAIVAIIIPPMAVLELFCFAVFFLLFQAVDRSNRELKRMAHQAMSPLLSNLSECVQMRRVARLTNSEDYFLSRNDQNTDAYTRMNYSSSMLMHFNKVMSSWLAALIAAGTTGWLMLVDRSEPERGAIAMTYAITIPYFLSMACQLMAFVKAMFTGLERLLEYTHLPQEPEWHLPGDPAASAWPTEGAVEFREVALRYRPNLPLALRGVSFAVPGGARVGIVGRTGSGKSSLVSCLFRLHEVASGQVLLDGLDVTSLGLQCLRRSLTVVPQDPVLMQGSVRKNLDPFGAVEPKQLRSALQRAELASTDQEADEVLNRELERGGSNLSCGERQLLCLARAVISGPRVLVMDEPTSSADPETDAKLQHMVRSSFMCTTLCIAHRIQTIADSDLVILMRDGQVAEFGPPAELLSKPSGAFQRMCTLTNVQIPAGAAPASGPALCAGGLRALASLGWPKPCGARQ